MIQSKEKLDIPIRYRGFILLAQPNQSWLVRPERSPMLLLPFRTNRCSLEEVKRFLDLKLADLSEISLIHAA